MLSGDTLTQVAYELQGNTDLKRLEQAWAETVAEHPSLRSVFRRLKNRRVQVLLKHRPIPIEWQDLRGMEAVEQQDAYQTIVNSHREPIQIDEGLSSGWRCAAWMKIRPYFCGRTIPCAWMTAVAT